MPLFAPLLRLLMLFLNVYDSYKTLKVPPPSARNEGRPSQRALTQRKRDMKGCLAVWIIWGCFMTYESFAEGLVSLLVPFYNEVKSLGMLFLILTRARGSEAIFLHVVRPLVKPYTPTIDMLLDIFRMCGDILFAIMSIPAEFISSWWNKSVFSTGEGAPDSETDRGASHRSSSSRKLTTDKISQSGTRPDQRSHPFPRKTSSDRQRPSSHNSRRSSGENDYRIISQRPDNVGGRQSRAPAHHTNGNANGSGNADTYKMWYPTPASYSDDEETHHQTAGASGYPTIEPDIGFLLNERASDNTEDWGRYPPFPSAYPVTPSVRSTAPLPKTSASQTTTLSQIQERDTTPASQQDFGRSLLPPRKPLSPGFAGGLSDEYPLSTGVQSQQSQSHTHTTTTRSENMFVDSDSGAADEEDDDDEEDVFNTTLQTPLSIPMPPLRATRSGIVPVIPLNRELSVASTVASRSSALTTTGKSSSLKTQSSSESLSSGALSVSDLSSVLGKKRPLPLDIVDVNSIRKGAGDGSVAGGRLRSQTRPDVGSPQRTSSRFDQQGNASPISGEAEDTTSISSTYTSDVEDDENVNESRKLALYPKRRKVVLSPRRSRAMMNPVRPVRPRVTRQATLPIRSQLQLSTKTVKDSSSGVAGAATITSSKQATSSRSQTRSMLLFEAASSSSSSDASREAGVPSASKRTTTRSMAAATAGARAPTIRLKGKSTIKENTRQRVIPPMRPSKST